MGDEKNRRAKGTIGLYVELPEKLYHELEAFAEARGTSKKAEVAIAVRRHMAYPDPAPLPDAAPPPAPANPTQSPPPATGKRGGRKGGATGRNVRKEGDA